MNKQYTADDVYKVMHQEGIRNILWNDLWLTVYTFNETDIWAWDEADEVHTTHEELARALNNGDTIEFYRLERVEI
jgi:hypothetical protein